MTVTVYTKERCQPCRATARWLDERGIVFEERPTADPTYLAEAKALGYMGAPVVVFVPPPGGSVKHWYGFNPIELEAMAGVLGKTEKIKEAA